MLRWYFIEMSWCLIVHLEIMTYTPIPLSVMIWSSSSQSKCANHLTKAKTIPKYIGLKKVTEKSKHKS